jgi:superfamily II DNA or RNA helicase
MLKDIEYKPSYCKGEDDIAKSFYIPSMKQAYRYDRISGYFSSAIYIIAWDAIKEFVMKQGKIRLVCSPMLSDVDQEALRKGYEAKEDTMIYNSIMSEIDSLFTSDTLTSPNKLLAYLIAEEYIDVKIAFVDINSPAQLKRLFHDKVGIFSDESQNVVGFRGSMNETYSGLANDGNIESIDVFPNWLDERDKARVQVALIQFEELWNNSATGVHVFEFPEAARSIIKTVSSGVDFEQLINDIGYSNIIAEKWYAGMGASAKRPREHQIAALEAWEANQQRGILEHATGSGKTFTAICAMRSQIEKGSSVVVLVPSIALLDQWGVEIEANISIPKLQLLKCGGRYDGWRKPGMLHRWTQKHPKNNAIVLSTMDTAVSTTFLNELAQGDHLMLVADEVHRLGSKNRRRILGINCGSSLGLSATPRRYGDPEGTRIIVDFFHGILNPPFTLFDAIKANVLTRYFYYPSTVYLSIHEQEEWDLLTKEISKIIARSSTSDINNVFDNPSLKMKLLARARIVKNASAKVKAALEIITKNYKDKQKWILYCDNQIQLNDVLQELLNLGYDAYEYRSDMPGDRKQTLLYFEKHGGILVSIRCLDEGVDIPSTTHALILASSQNPREFIQRRGRILRKAEGKYYAHLYDIIVLPNNAKFSYTEEDGALSIVASELARAIEFGKMAENPSCIAKLKNITVDYEIDIDKVKEGGFEVEEE